MFFGGVCFPFGAYWVCHRRSEHGFAWVVEFVLRPDEKVAPATPSSSSELPTTSLISFLVSDDGSQRCN
ncbi:hypothetical protein E2562_014811 [Oryza meyeriana var. granulata]|uniref:Uncharacterized protein n=1 Tax=Oryza meyeriana var. granulata TaxID=110450 RepID=A0A6G1BW74_9ORYZ|nr:hypothetical protein E2562_014811 [Oryza meyeriana var. granulata]